MKRSSFPGRTLIHVLLVAAAALALAPHGVHAQSSIAGWGSARFDTRWNDEVFVEIAAGSDQTLARRGDGTVVAWGDNEAGQIDVPTLPPGLVYVQIAAGGGDIDGHSLARRSDGSVVAWGRNVTGQCNVPANLPGLTYVDIDAGRDHSVAIRSNGTVAAWGSNQFGQCYVIPGIYVEIAAAHHHTLARRSDGTVVAWGQNGHGQCNVPAPPAGVTYVEIAAGRHHCVARRSDDSVVAWGDNSSGQCNVPAPPPGRAYVDVAAGGNGPNSGFSVARLSDGSFVGWGTNAWSQCNVPALPGGVTYVEIDVLAYSTITLRSDGSVEVFGGLPAPTLPNGLKYVEVDAGVAHYVARRSDGAVVAWGRNVEGQCVVPPLPPGLTYVEVDAGGFHSVARRSDGSIVTWGSNEFGECNVPPLPPGLTYVEIEGGGSWSNIGNRTLARRSDGSVVAWGDNFYGQCDIPPLPSGLSYVEIAAGTWDTLLRRSDGEVVGSSFQSESTIIGIAAGDSHVAAVRSDGTAVARGFNIFGQCDVPVLPNGLRYVEIGAGDAHTAALYEGCATCEPAFCLGDGGGSGHSVPCPCGNVGATGRGCDNSAATGGSKLAVEGDVDPDSVVLTVRHELPSAASIFLQGSAVVGSPVAFGDGVRCIGGTLLRIGVKTAVAGAAHYPDLGDPPISARSAALGDRIRPGTFRYYQVYYRDSDPTFCNAAATFNASNAVMVAW